MLLGYHSFIHSFTHYFLWAHCWENYNFSVENSHQMWYSPERSKINSKSRGCRMCFWQSLRCSQQNECSKWLGIKTSSRDNRILEENYSESQKDRNRLQPCLVVGEDLPIDGMIWLDGTCTWWDWRWRCETCSLVPTELFCLWGHSWM